MGVIRDRLHNVWTRALELRIESGMVISRRAQEKAQRLVRVQHTTVYQLVTFEKHLKPLLV